VKNAYLQVSSLNLPVQPFGIAVHLTHFIFQPAELAY
jgi:hypothetical protein